MTANEMFKAFEEVRVTMNAVDLKAAFYNGYCLGTDKAYPGSYAPHWFWILPHQTPSMGLIPRKRGWNSHHETHIWDQIYREPERWVIGNEVDGKFQPLDEVRHVHNS